eukprot:gene3879-4840_t
MEKIVKFNDDHKERLTQLLGRDFSETGIVGMQESNDPCPCCGKPLELVDYLKSAINSNPVHSKEFLFKSLKSRNLGPNNIHSVDCSKCGTARGNKPWYDEMLEWSN